jgi:hypothetical protein
MSREFDLRHFIYSMYCNHHQNQDESRRRREWEDNEYESDGMPGNIFLLVSVCLCGRRVKLRCEREWNERRRKIPHNTTCVK